MAYPLFPIAPKRKRNRLLPAFLRHSRVGSSCQVMLAQSSGSLEVGAIIASETQSGVSYRLESAIGEGGMGVAYLAQRLAPDGTSPVVVKLVHTNLAEARISAELVAQKEAVALGRLNECVPPPPFVVRLLDAGVRVGDRAQPWTVLEYVHGGVEGSTLEERVTYAVHRTGYAFDPRRAAHALRCLSLGLDAIHSVGVLHRDLTPSNVLCCGFGSGEIFKISDFGVSRALGLHQTFGGVMLGTLGYTAPEASSTKAGPNADVFSLAAIVYYLLTGQAYFETTSLAEMVRLVSSSDRPSLLNHPTLCPELTERPHSCHAIDQTLARATSLESKRRPSSAHELAELVMPQLQEHAAGPRSSARLVAAISRQTRAQPREFQWTLRSRALDGVMFRSIAWDSDGRAMGLTRDGALFWNGSAWVDARALSHKLPDPVSLVQRYEAGGWLFAGKGPRLHLADHTGVTLLAQLPASDGETTSVSGSAGDLLVVAQESPGQPPTLWTCAARRWLRPLQVAQASMLTSLARLDDARWLVGGRKPDGRAFAAVYSPFQFSLEPIDAPEIRAFIGGASAHEQGSALLAGTDGLVLRASSERVEVSWVSPSVDLAAAAIDAEGREWTAGLGCLWSREPGQAQWRTMWQGGLVAPFRALLAQSGLVMGVCVDGCIVEGRVAQPEQHA